LGNQFKEIELRNEWAYRLAGWYNISSAYKPMLSMLLDSQKEEIGKVVDVLAMMKYSWSNSYGLIDEDLREERRI
jgi:rRNA processing protein Gar1